MAYGILKCDTVTFTNAGVDKSVTLSGLVQNPTFSGNVTVTGTVSGTTATFTTGTFTSLTGTTSQGTTATYTSGSFTSLTGVTTSGTTANFVSGVFTTQISGATITGTAGAFATLTGGVATLTSGVFALGTEALPSITFTGDTDTGIYSPGANQVAISTSGTGKLFVSSSGNVGIGIAAPGRKLTASADASVDTAIQAITSVAGSYIQFTDSTDSSYIGTNSESIVFLNPTTERARITSDGTVNIKGAGTAGVTQAVSFNGSAPVNSLVLTSGGNVGIGTANPNVPLTVQADSNAYAHDLIGRTADNTSIIRFKTSDNVTALGSIGQYGTTMNINSIGAGPIVFYTNDEERASIDSSGRLLVGTPSARLLFTDYTPTIQLEGTTNSKSSASLINNSNGAAGPTLFFAKSRATSNGGVTVVSADDELGVIAFNGADGTDLTNIGATIKANVDGTPAYPAIDLENGQTYRIVTVGTTNFMLIGASANTVGTVFTATGPGAGTGTAILNAGNMPSRLVFSTTADGASSPTERMRIDSNGNVTIQNEGDLYLASADNTVEEKNLISWRIEDGSEGARISAFREAVSNAPHSIAFFTRTSGGLTNEKARIDSSGRLLVGTPNARSGIGSRIQLEGAGGGAAEELSLVYNGENTVGPRIDLVKTRGAAVGANTAVINDDELGLIRFYGADGTSITGNNGASIGAYVDGDPFTFGDATDLPTRLVFSTTADGASSPTERMRITQAGNIVIGQQATTTDPAGQNVAGTVLGGLGYISMTRDTETVLRLNRKTNDGTLVGFLQDGIEEGTISVSGTTVSYNGAHLSRWSQLPSGAERTEILRGTVLSNIDEMCEWGEEDNEQLNRMKVSDVEGDKNVSGVFQAWDDDDDTYTNDFYCAMTGDFIIRIAQGVTVERGDLLMSAGDGTAKPQDDDIIRSKTIAKVTSTNVSCTYEDGSYCVPCVLMAC